VSPPIEALEGIWHVFRDSVRGSGCDEPTAWTDNGIRYKLAWDGRTFLNEYDCTSATECKTTPNYLQFRVEDGHWVARSQNVTSDGSCQWEQEDLALLDGGVLRQTFGTYTVTQGCGPNIQSLAVCSQGWSREARRQE
jgi:hypothetical protein